MSEGFARKTPSGTIWITRTQPSAQESAKIWEEAGFEPLVLPLLRVEPVAHQMLPDEAVFVFTSKNGVDHAGPARHRRAICVGDATAERAKMAGYQDVISVGGTSKDVTQWILGNLSKRNPIIHISGRHIRGQIVEDLKGAGFKASRMIVYASSPNSVSTEQSFTHVALYSPLAAKIFAKTMGKTDLSDKIAVSISPATDVELEGLKLKLRLIADHPNEMALVRAAITP